MVGETKWKIKGLEVQVPNAQFLKEFKEKMRLRLGESGDVDSAISGLFGVHFYIKGGTDTPDKEPGKTGYAITMDEADELAKWLVERIQDIRERSSIKSHSGKEVSGKNNT
jgi:hypothetical protein